MIERVRSMNKLILSIKKRFLIPAVFLTALLVWLGLCRSHYESYWNGTIHKVQTVDFNILHHTLPATLSLLIMAGREDEIQKVLDCNFGIFGLAVTDPAGREILFRTKAVYKKESWQKLLSIDYLEKQQEPFDYLTDPPPMTARHAHPSPRVDKITMSKLAAGGTVIGRVYYLRGLPPAFAEDVIEAIFSNWFEMAGSKRGYILLTFIVLATSGLVVTLVLWRQRVLEARESALQTRENELAVKRKALSHLTADLAAQRQKKEWLEQEAEISYQRALRLKESLVKMRTAFAPDGASQNSADDTVKVRPPQHAASQLISEVESLLPELSHNAAVMRSHAQVWQTYCAQLEQRQDEMESMLRQQQVYWQPGVPDPDSSPTTEGVAAPRQHGADAPVNMGRGEQAAKFS